MAERGEFAGIYTALLDDPQFQDLSPQARWVLVVIKLCLGLSGIGVLYPETVARKSGYSPAVIAQVWPELIAGDWIHRTPPSGARAQPRSASCCGRGAGTTWRQRLPRSSAAPHEGRLCVDRPLLGVRRR